MRRNDHRRHLLDPPIQLRHVCLTRSYPYTYSTLPRCVLRGKGSADSSRAMMVHAHASLSLGKTLFQYPQSIASQQRCDLIAVLNV